MSAEIRKSIHLKVSQDTAAAIPQSRTKATDPSCVDPSEEMTTFMHLIKSRFYCSLSIL